MNYEKIYCMIWKKMEQRYIDKILTKRVCLVYKAPRSHIEHKLKL